jgi:hypothetical protein
MTLDQLTISVVGILVAAVTAIVIGHLHRKQMRQNELFRLDPSVGLRPPPSFPVTFFKQYWDVIGGIGLPILSVGISIVTNQPVTLASVITISVNVGCIVWTLALRSERRLWEGLNDQANALLTTVDALRAIQEQTSDGLRKHSELFSLIAKGVEIQTKLNAVQHERLEAADDGKAPPKGE